MDIAALGRACCLHTASLSRTLPILEADGLVSRKADTQDQRRVSVSLTAKGRRLFEVVAPQSEAIYARLAQEIGPERLEHIYGLLDEVIGILETPRPAVKSAAARARSRCGAPRQDRAASWANSPTRSWSSPAAAAASAAAIAVVRARGRADRDRRRRRSQSRRGGDDDRRQPVAAAAHASRAICRSSKAAQALHALVKEKLGRCDVLVNNAGATRRPAISSNCRTRPGIDGFALKFFGCVRLWRLFWPMLKAAQGRVVNIGGGAARTPGADFLIGGSVNAAMANFSKALSRLGKSDGVNVNVIHPGADRDRPLQDAVRAARAGVRQDHRTRSASSDGQGRHLRRIGKPEDVAELTLFLCSEQGAAHPGRRDRGRWRLDAGILLTRNSAIGAVLFCCAQR